MRRLVSIDLAEFVLGRETAMSCEASWLHVDNLLSRYGETERTRVECY